MKTHTLEAGQFDECILSSSYVGFFVLVFPLFLCHYINGLQKKVIVSLKRKYVPFAAVVLLSLKRKVNEVNSGT